MRTIGARDSKYDFFKINHICRPTAPFPVVLIVNFIKSIIAL